MLRKTLFSLLFLLLTLVLEAQDTITVMQYNLLEYGNFNSGWASCYESNNNTQEKDENIRKILELVKPDILTVNEFGASQEIQESFINHNLNINGVSYWKSDDIVNYANSNIINHIFYNSEKMKLTRHAVIRTSVRDLDAYELMLKTDSPFVVDTIRLVCLVAHLKAGQSSTDESKRRSMLQNAMYFIEENYPTDNVLIMGDFNMYSSAESGYRLLTQNYPNNDILFVDPLSLVGGVGYWDNNWNYAPFHTQSTTASNDNPCRSSGGMDSRFDMILMSDEIYMGYHNVRYVNNSYRALGNDGEHFNMSINQGYNSSVSPDIANALYAVSDHLPITMQLAVNAHLDVEDYEDPSVLLQVRPNPFHNTLKLSGIPMEEVRVYNMQGQLIHSERCHNLSTVDMALEGFASGMYLLSIITEKQLINKKIIKE